jgi:membrane-associated phospholipid phosphatase
VRPDATPLGRRLLVGALIGFLAAVPITLLALSARGALAPLRRLDRILADALNGWAQDRPGVVRAFKAIDVWLQPTVFRAAVAVLVAVLLWRGARRLAAWAAVTMITGSLLGFFLKLVFARHRPEFDAPVGSAPGFSFPSGHALNSAVGTLVLLLVIVPALPSRRARVIAWSVGAGVVLLVGLDRIALGVHFLTDVVGGWIIAAAVVTATAAAFERWRRDRGRPPSGPLDGVEPEASRELV